MPAILRRLVRIDSPGGGLLRDVFRLATIWQRRTVLPMVLEALALSRPHVFFVQVGSNDGINRDPLRRFVLAYGWQGVLVEPVPYVFERLERNCAGRPGLTVEKAAIAAHDGAAEFYSIAETTDPIPDWYDQLGSFRREIIVGHAKYLPDIEERIEKLQVPTLTFESLCRKHGIGAIDLIHTDAEGLDYEIIRSIDFEAHRPSLLLYAHRHLRPEEHAACRAHLQERGYLLLGISGGDTIAIRRELTTGWNRLARTWRLARLARQSY